MATPTLSLVHLSPTADSRLRWADGSLKGMKVLRWQHGEVMSPMHPAVWVAGKLTAREFYEGDDTKVRGEGGIHAIWPPQLKLDLDAECAALQEFQGYAPRNKREFTVLVRGWGRTVMGDVGWRAEHAAIATVISPPRQNARALRQWCREHNIGWSVL